MRVLILCTGNSARSQMAEGLLRSLSHSAVEAYSAGIHPSRLNPLAIEVLKEVGIDISAHRSKSVQEFAGQGFDTVITVCDNARESCPNFPGAPERLHWSYPEERDFSLASVGGPFDQANPLALPEQGGSKWQPSQSCDSRSALLVP